MKKLIVWFCFLFFPGIVFSADIRISLMPQDFKYSLELNGAITKDNIYQIHLENDVLEKCTPGSKDIRLFDSKNNEIPYVILDYNYIPEKDKIQKLKITKYHYDENSAVIRLSTLKKEKSIQINTFYLDITNRDFNKKIKISGSNNGKKWVLIKEDTIYDFSSQVDLRKTEVEFESVSYPYYLITLTDEEIQKDSQQSIKLKYDRLEFSVDNIENKKLHINSVIGKFKTEKSKNIIYDEKFFTGITASLDKNGDTVIEIEAKLPVKKIYFDINNAYYYRKARVYYSDTGDTDSYKLLKKGVIYTFTLFNVTDVKNYLCFSSPKYNFYKLVIENKNNPPLDIKNITFKWIQKNLYFVAINNDTQHFLCFGNKNTDKPEYDLSKFIHKNNWYKQDYTKLEESDILDNDNFISRLGKNKKAQIEKIILMTIVIFLVLGISFFLYSLMKKARGTKIIIPGSKRD